MNENISLQITWKCDIGCKHCCQGPKKASLSVAEVNTILKEIKKQNIVHKIHITGGEPFEDIDKLLLISKSISNYDFEFAVITNGKWCKGKEVAEKILRNLKSNNLIGLTISYDSYHAKFVNEESIKILINVATSMKIPVTLYASYCSDTQNETDHILSRISRNEVEIRKRWILPVGIAKINKISTNYKKYSELNDFCPTSNILTFFPTGDCYPCCSAGTHNNLSIGNIRHEKLSSVIYNRFNNPYMKIIEEEGPKGIVERLPWSLKEKLKANRYTNTCHLCYEILETCDARSLITEESIDEYDVVAHILG